MRRAIAGVTTRHCAAARAFHSTPLALLQKGKVISWMAGRGFGFIEEADTKKQHFCHFSSLKIEPGGYRAVAVGQEVEFDAAMVDGRSRAENVTAPGGLPLPSGVRPEGSGPNDKAQVRAKMPKKKIDPFNDDF